MKHICNFKGCREFLAIKGQPRWLLQDVCKENIPSQYHMNAYDSVGFETTTRKVESARCPLAGVGHELHGLSDELLIKP